MHLPDLSFSGPQVVLGVREFHLPFRRDLTIIYLTSGLRVIHIQALSSSRARAS